jgi:hypothetical protein
MVCHQNRWTLLLLTSVLLFRVTTACLDVEAAIITIVNNDAAGEGFNDPTPVAPVGGNNGTTRGAQRLIVVQRAADIWGDSSSVP